MNFNKKNTIKIFLGFYLFGFLIFNWQDVSWVFNYRMFGSIVYNFFNPYQEKDIVNDYLKSNLPTPTITNIKHNVTSNEKDSILLDNILILPSDKNNILEIPSLLVRANIVFPNSKDINILNKFLDSGAIYYPDSVLPNQKGEIIILGHSAPPGWPKIKHDWIFSDLEKLKTEDIIYLNLDYKKYTYKVIDKKIINKGEDIPENMLTKEKNMIILISCYPPGKDFQRILVYGEILLIN